MAKHPAMLHDSSQLQHLMHAAMLQAVDDEEVFLNIDLMHLYEFDRELYSQLTAYPGEVIPLLDAEARYIAADLLGEELPENKELTVRFRF